MSRTEPRHPYLEVLEPYQPPDLEAAAQRAGVEEDDLIRLVANENPFGPSPRVAAALGAFEEYHWHPDYGALQEAVARYAGVPASQVVLGNGADELIDLLIRLFVEPGEAVVISPPTFSMYRFCARVNRCAVLTAPRRANLSIDARAIEALVQGGRVPGEAGEERGEARLLFVVSPGNPSGQAVPLDMIERLLALPLTVVVDEAYIEFGGQTAVSLLPEHENLVILRTFSKWAGMAGLRLGYALLNGSRASYLERMRAPYNVNAAAMVAALATFEDLEAVQANVARLVEERDRLTEGLSDIAWLEPVPSEANFILCRVVGREARAVVDDLLNYGILIRGFSDPLMAEYVRITVGRPDQNDALVRALGRMT